MKPTDTLRERAGESATKLKAAQDATAQAETLNAAESQRLDTLASEISEREHRMDCEDLAQVADVENRKRQLEMLRAKATKDGAKRLADAKLRTGELVGDAKLAQFFEMAYRHHFDAVRESLLPFIDEPKPLETEAVVRTVNGLSGIGKLHTWMRYTPTPERALAILEKFCDGVPLWECE